MSKSLIKIVDNSLLPASILILSKFLGIVFIVKISGISWSAKEYSDNLFSVGNSLPLNEVKTVVTYSDLIMFIVMAIFLSFNIFRAVYLHNTHVDPKLVNKLAKTNLLGLIQDSYHIYHQAVSWLIFGIIANAVILTNVFSGTTEIAVGLAATVFTLLITAILIQDVYKELDNMRKHPGKYFWS